MQYPNYTFSRCVMNRMQIANLLKSTRSPKREWTNSAEFNVILSIPPCHSELAKNLFPTRAKTFRSFRVGANLRTLPSSFQIRERSMHHKIRNVQENAEAFLRGHKSRFKFEKGQCAHNFHTFWKNAEAFLRGRKSCFKFEKG